MEKKNFELKVKHCDAGEYFEVYQVFDISSTDEPFIVCTCLDKEKAKREAKQFEKSTKCKTAVSTELVWLS